MDCAIDRAVADCNGARLLESADLVAVARSGTLRYRNAAASIAARRGLVRARTLQADFGGHMAQVLVAKVAEDIAEGRCDVALVAGSEMGSLLRRPDSAQSTEDESGPTSPMIGDDIGEWISHPYEASLGLTLPAQIYPLLEVALAWEKGEALSAHMGAVAEQWSRFSAVAAANPHASDRRTYSPAAIFPARPDNRFVGYPYTKLMNSDQFVDQACAQILCSNEAADAAGIALDRRIFIGAAAEADNGFVSHRASLADAPGLARAAGAMEAVLGRRLREAPLLDLYACFPAAVALQAQALDLNPLGTHTVTGGMRFAGGPWNSYALHMIANLALRLRESSGDWAVSSANGGLASRFSLLALAAAPFATGYQRIPTRFERRSDEICSLVTTPEADARIEAFSVTHDRSNTPKAAFAACRTPDGARCWAHFQNPDSLATMLEIQRPGPIVRWRDGRPEVHL
jgi:acetyl-CoA C-acetyltransferase